MHRSYYSIVIGIFSLIISAQTHPLEHMALHNIRQITFPSMGFEKAGESYFSPDGTTLLFQAVPTGKKEYQIYSIDIEKGEATKEDGEKDDYNKDLNDVIDIIKKEGGRTTQKDIRKQIPLSEAKISLMIAELEHKGVIEKIKKGRGNIIILKKNEI